MVPSTKTIAVLAGDHAGQEVMPEAIKVLKIVETLRPQLKFELQEHLIGGCSIDETGSALTDDTLKAIKKVDAVLLGAVGGPKWVSTVERTIHLTSQRAQEKYGQNRDCLNYGKS